MENKIEATAFHKWLFTKTKGHPVEVANQLVYEVIQNQNPQAFALLAATGDTEYTPETFIKAAKILCDICNEWAPNYCIPKS